MSMALQDWLPEVDGRGGERDSSEAIRPPSREGQGLPRNGRAPGGPGLQRCGARGARAILGRRCGVRRGLRAARRAQAHARSDDRDEQVGDRLATLASAHGGCDAPEGRPARGRVSHATSSRQHRSTDLQVLATLAERAEWAQRHDRTELAAAIRQQRRLFVLEHAGRCLGGLARELGAGGPILAAAGSMLTALLAAERS